MTNTHFTPRVSIGMPVYNAERYLEKTIISVLHQTYSDFVVYICDNASTDRTAEICKAFAENDPRVRYVRNSTNIGGPKNFNKCFRLSKSEFFRWQNADDTIEPTLIEVCVETLDKDPDAVMAYVKANVIDENDNFMYVYEDDMQLAQEAAFDRFFSCIDNIRMQNLMYGLIRSETLEKTNLMGSYLSADINLIGEITLHGKCIEIDQTLFNRRKHPKSTSSSLHDKDSQKAFWAPDAQRLTLDFWISFFEYFKAVSRAPLTNREKLKISYHLIKRMYWYKEKLLTEAREYWK